MDFLGIKYIVVGKYENPSSKYFHTHAFEGSLQKIYEDNTYIVYQNLDASPRFGLFYHVATISSGAKMLNTLSRWNDNEENTVFLEEKLPIRLSTGTGSAQLVDNMPNEQIFRISSTANALFYVSDTFFPGWIATVNGKPEKIYRADYNFRAILVPKGISTIEFTYRPVSYIVGIIVSCVSIGIVIVVFMYSFVWKKKEYN